jgi:hypothetical protein
MDYERRDGDTVIFRNVTDNEKAPAYKGTILLDGNEYNISLWVKDGAKGKFFSGRTELKMTKMEPHVGGTPFKDKTDDLPF